MSSWYRSSTAKHPSFLGRPDPTTASRSPRAVLDRGGSDFGTDRILIGGESAGAYLSAAVALRIRDEVHAIDRIDGLNLTYGIYDFGGTPSQRGRRPSDGFDILSPEFIRLVTDCYLPGRTNE